MSDMPEYEKIIKMQNQVLMDTKVDKRKQKLLWIIKPWCNLTNLNTVS